jgi:prepilin-type N-terminal cleavage/methylation domain-containing protein
VRREAARRRVARRRERGFTLVEVIVAVALTGIVLAVLFAGIGIGFKGMVRIDSNADRLERRRQIDFMLRRQLGAAYPASDARPTEATFGGAPEAMNFLAIDGANGPGFYRVWLSLDRTGGERRLVLARQSVAGGSIVGFESTVLARNVVEFRLSYFGVTEPNEPPRWQDRWEGRRWLPEMVRLHLTLADEAARRHPDTLIRLWTAEPFS